MRTLRSSPGLSVNRPGKKTISLVGASWSSARVVWFQLVALTWYRMVSAPSLRSVSIALVVCGERWTWMGVTFRPPARALEPTTRRASSAARAEDIARSSPSR